MENQITAQGKDVVIIGGGDTGADCLGTAIRQGAKSITQLEIMPTPPEERPTHQPWPTYPMIYRVSSAHEEAGERVYSVSTTEFAGDETGTVASLKIVRGDVRERQGRTGRGDRAGDAGPTRAAGHGLRRPGDATPWSDQLGVDIDERGNVARDEDYATTSPVCSPAGTPAAASR